MADDKKTGADSVEVSQAKALLKLAQEQLDSIGKVIPEGKEAMDKYPGLNPIGHYSEIDMGFAERMKRCESSIRLRDPLSWEEYNHLKEEMEASPAFVEMKKEMETISKRMRVVDRALRLCEDDKVRKILETEKQGLQNRPVLKDYGLAVKTLERYSGVDAMTERDKDTEQLHAENKEAYLLFKNKLGIQIGSDLYYDPYSRAVKFSNPKSLEIEFEDLDDIMQARRMVSDEGKGKSWDEVENLAPDRNSFAKHAAAIPSYMQASCDRILDNALPNVKDRADFILINGVSVREQMKTVEGIENPTDEQIKKFSSLYVAAALRNGIHVETFTRDYHAGDKNKINYKPVPITVKGKDSYVTKKSAENEMEKITIGFLDRFLAKLGFSYFQKKLEKAAALEAAREEKESKEAPQRKAREEFRAANRSSMKYALSKEELEASKKAFEILHKNRDGFFKNREGTLNYSTKQKDMVLQFFPNGRKDVVNKATGKVVANNREKLRTFAIVEMLNAGFSLEEILDTTKHVAEREQMAARVAEKLENADARTFYQMHMDASATLNNALSDYAKKHNISFKNPESVHKEAFLMDLAVGVGNVVDILVDSTENKEFKELFGNDAARKVDEATKGSIVLGMLPKAASRLTGIYTRLADGLLPSAEDMVEVIYNEVLETVFAKMEEISQTPYYVPISMEEMMGIQQMVVGHPNVEKLLDSSSPEKLGELISQKNILKALQVDFKVLPHKVVPGISVDSDKFLVSFDPDTTTPTRVIPTFKGKSGFYQFQQVEKTMDDFENTMDEGFSK